MMFLSAILAHNGGERGGLFFLLTYFYIFRDAVRLPTMRVVIIYSPIYDR